ncbi:hypothetical protein PENARI_c044G07091 [Penicillium arizonense]|uniref:Uncharacterized protein n=1 Tax=Penicillium arizonense TaxID=1835702 RepID=A0A1F5L334_PENAI|nr:hypothetical protein PENARI_c044G07091 [Penicillium arizonense]OGE47456.1 hypothetical protein PENARI_c044G07091 [Penicillium arizonense]
MVPGPNLKVSDRPGLKSPPEDRTLRFRKDGTFHIAVFEDLHFAERERTLKSNYSKYVLSVISPLVNEGYLWASTYGNHDSEINLDPEEDQVDA